MRRFIPAVVVLAFLFYSVLAAAQSHPAVLKTAPPAWVNPVAFDAEASPAAGQEEAFYYLLIDEQEHRGKQARYFRVVYKILATEGIQSMSDITADFDPAYQTLTFHHARIHRNGEIIDQLQPPVKTIQREASMDRHLYDGSLTAIIHLRDVRVGDIIEYAFTTVGHNPVFDGHAARKVYFTYNVPYEDLQYRLLTPTGQRLNFFQHNTDIRAKQSQHAGTDEYQWRQRRKPGLLYDNNTPSWFDANEYIAMTDFASWQEVAAWALKHYALSASDLEKLAAQIGDQFSDDDEEASILKAIRFVQDDVRYLGFESGLSSHKPHPPLQVFEQRFGDCKDKSLLLCAILRTQGIEAWPVLVHTERAAHIERELPSYHAFNHCVVQIKRGEETINIDPTLSNQGGTLNTIPFPAYGKGLVIAPSTTDLSDLHASVSPWVYEEQLFDMTDLEGEAYLQVVTKFTGERADNIRRYFSNNTLESIQKSYRDFYGNLYPDIEVAAPVTIDDNREINRVEVSEVYRIPAFWKPADTPDVLYAELSAQTLESYFSVDKAARKHPYALDWPLSYRHSIQVRLPEPWTVEPEFSQVTSDHYDYSYAVNYNDNKLSLETHYRTLTDHIPPEGFEQFVKDHGLMSGNLSFQLSFNKTLASVGKGASWFGILTALVALGLGLWLALYIYYYYDPVPRGRAPGESLSIGGWLILPAIGLSITPLRLVYDMFQLPEVYDNQTWSGLWSLEKYDLLGLIFVTHVYNIFLLCFSVVLVILFFQRRSSVPLLMTIYLVVTSLMTIMDELSSIALDPSTDSSSAVWTVFRTVIAAAIWVPYFNISTRVKDTFVHRITEEDADDVPENYQAAIPTNAAES